MSEKDIYALIIGAGPLIYFAGWVLIGLIEGVVWYALDHRLNFWGRRIVLLMAGVVEQETEQGRQIWVPWFRRNYSAGNNYGNDWEVHGGMMSFWVPLIGYPLVTAGVLFLPTFMMTAGAIVGILTLIRVITLKIKRVTADLKYHAADPNAHNGESK